MFTVPRQSVEVDRFFRSGPNQRPVSLENTTPPVSNALLMYATQSALGETAEMFLKLEREPLIRV